MIDTHREDPRSFIKLAQYCNFMHTIYGSKILKTNLAPIFYWTNLEGFSIALFQESYLLLGFWMAKMEEKRRNIMSAGGMTTKKLDNIEKVKPIFEKYGKSIKALTLAMSETGITTSRTIKEYFKILEEKKTK